MGARIYVGGLPYSADETKLGDVFARYGTVASVRVITDRITGKSRGFGFVEMSNDQEAESAISALNGTEMDGRTLTVNEARPQEPRFTGDRPGRGGGPGGERPGGGRGRRGPGGPGGPGGRNDRKGRW